MSQRFVILASRPGRFRTEPGETMRAVEAWDYLCDGKRHTHFVIAELEHEGKVRVVDESGPVNLVPSKFLDHFDSLAAARDELKRLARFGRMHLELVPAPA